LAFPVAKSNCKLSDDFDACLKNPPVSWWIASPIRRAFDIAVAAVVLVLTFVPMLIIGACVELSSKGRAVFAQDRLGLGGRPFRIYKFRSMSERHGENRGSGLTKAGDSRITRLGQYLRRFKLDELPQFFNILRGDMSLVGPRPKLAQYSALSNMPYRPGITGTATLAFRHEEEVLRDVHRDSVEKFYAENIKPIKARLDVCYMCRATPLSDLRVIGATVLHCVAPTLSSSLIRVGVGSGNGAGRTKSTVPEESPSTH